MVAKKKTSAKKTAKKAAVKSKKKPVKKTETVLKQTKGSNAKKSASKKTKKKKGDTLMCFLTTACVRHYHLADNGYELNTLRKYRDTYLASSNGGKELIEEYYTVSPAIVRLIERDKNKHATYEFIYNRVQTACKQIEQEKFMSAKKTYARMVRHLMKHYHVSVASVHSNGYE